MQILDDDFVYKITGSFEFIHYQNAIRQKLFFKSVLFFITLLLIFVFSTMQVKDWFAIVVLFSIPAVLFLFSGILNLFDLLWRKLHVKKDVFLHIHHEFISDNNSPKQSLYYARMQSLGDILLFTHAGEKLEKTPKNTLFKLEEMSRELFEKVYKIEENTEVYVIRTGISKSLLDIRPCSDFI